MPTGSLARERHMPETYVIDAQGRHIDINDDPRRIAGLVAEDKARTLTLFRPGNYAENPTAPVDIAPFHDVLQGLGTHVKSILQKRKARKPGKLTPGTIELASTLEFMRLSGHQRYILLFYELDGKIVINDKTYDIRRYHTAIEIILSPTTLAVMRGDYTLTHLAWMQRKLDEYRPTPETIEAKQEQFTRYTDEFRRFFGMATHSVKLNIAKKTGKTGNKRIQSTVPIPQVQEQLSGEGPYHGRFTQPNYREWFEGENFYGMNLPWYTTATDTIYSSIGDPDAPLDDKAVKEMRKRDARRANKRVVAPLAPPATSSDDRRYAAEEPVTTTLRAFNKGMITIVRQQDNARTISIDAVDADAFNRAHEMCEKFGGRWFPVCGRWGGDLTFAKNVVNALNAAKPGNLPPPEPDHVDPLPSVPNVNPLRQSPRNPRLFYFDVGSGEAAALLMEKGNWVLMPQNNMQVADIIQAACAPHAPLTPWDGNHKGDWTVRLNDRGSWLVRDTPTETIQRVVRAIQDYRY